MAKETRSGNQLYMLDSVWDKVKAQAKKENRSTNNWIEMQLSDIFISPKEKVLKAAKQDKLI